MATKEPEASDKTVAGGRYLVNDVLVDAKGEPIKETKAEKAAAEKAAADKDEA